ncbi:MAG: hypothetical protein KBS54_07595, partial [Synergistaceae bacterium]|nr:hypothetical protein [Candidatus Equadaptatus faecalis]
MRTTKKLAAVLMLVSFIFSTVSPAMAAGLADITDIAGGNGGNALGNASTIYFGNYWQNAKSGKSGSTNLNDYNKEGIKWRVLSNADGKTLLLSDQGLYADAFNHSDSPSKDNVWKYSHVRAILNNTTADDGFAGDAFSDKEYAAIAETTLSDVDSTDKIFLLSADEVQNTDYGFAAGTSANDTRKALATEMAQHIPVYGNAYYSRSTVDLFDGYPYWWLRSPGGASKKAYCVGNEGDVNYTYGDIGYCDDAVRPALNLNQESVLFLSAAVATKSDGTNYDKNSKSQVGVGDGFALADYDGSNGWKLTLFDKYDATEDTGIKTPNVTQAEIVGKTWDVNDLAETAKTGTKIIEISDQTPTGDEGLKIAYNGAATGTNMYVSALLKDKTTGNYVNYAKVSQDAADTEIIDVSGISGNYTLCIYGEQENGDYQTDYASELYRKDITIPTDMPAPTVNKILSSDYAAGGLTAKISNDCELGFEAGEYDTAVTIEDDKSGKITADASGTTLTGNISVGTDATLTTANTFTLDGAISGEGTIENTGTLNVNGTLAAAVTNNDSVTAKSGSTINSTVTNAAAATTTLETGAAFGAAGKISGGTAVLKENVEFTASNLDGITAFNADKAIYNFSATLNSADPYITAGNIINVDGNATGTIKLGTITLNGTSSDGWAVGTPEEMQYLNATGTDTNLTVDGYQVQTNTGYKYTFSQAKDGSADKIGYMSVLKESETELTLKDLVNNTSTAAGSTNQYTVDGLDETTTEDLGALDNTLRGGKFAIVGSNGDPATDILDGNGNGGIIVADTEHGGAAGDELTLKDITVQNFTPAVTNKEGGTVSLENVIFKNNEDWDIVNEGTVNLTKTNEFDKGISGADGAIVVKDGASLTGQSEGATTITTDTLDGNGDLTAENITINVTGDGGSIVGNLTLEDMTITGAGVDATEETVAGLNLNGTVTV